MKLNAAGRKARDRAVASLTTNGLESFRDVVDAYARAVDTADRIRVAWEKAGCDPKSDLVASARAQERTVAFLARQLRLTPAEARRTGVPGRPPGAASAPDRAAQPEAVADARAIGAPPRLRRVEGGAA